MEYLNSRKVYIFEYFMYTYELNNNYQILIINSNGGELNMVKRTKAEMVEAFDGICDVIEVVSDQINEGKEQIHLEIKPDDSSILEGTKTGKFHVWLRMTEKTTESSVPEGSNLDRYLQEIETVCSEAKKAEKVIDAVNVLKGKHVHFVRKIIGRSFKGFEARPIFVPQSLIK